MITKDDIRLVSYEPFSTEITSVMDDKPEYTFFSLDVEFILFNSITCKITSYKEIPYEDIHDYLVEYMNQKLTK